MIAHYFPPQFFELSPNSLVTDGQRAYRVTHLISVDSLLAVDLETNDPKRLAIEILRPYVAPAEVAEVVTAPADRDLMNYSVEEWAVAQYRLQVIKPYLERVVLTQADAEVIAKKHNIHVATFYRWAKLYVTAGHVSALVPFRRGRKLGTTLLLPAQEQIVTSVIEDHYLTKQKLIPHEAIEEVQRRCRLAKVKAPHPNTVRNRIAALPAQEVFARRGQKDKAARFTALRGSFPGADFPLAFVQIDHTPADIICVDEVFRQPVARPYVTVAIDVFSRMVVGFYLSYDPPSATSVALCLAQAMNSKREYLANLDVPGSWPVWGRIGTVHCDNAKEFRGAVLERACEEYNINLAWRPVKTPRYGGHIENMMGRVAREMHTLPGTTFSNIQERGDYDSEMQSAMTLKELERHLADFFVNKYHLRKHSALKISPKKKWEFGLLGDANTPGSGIVPLPHDPERILLDFLPFIERTVQTYGIQLDSVQYYDPVLDDYINSADPANPKAKRLFTVRRDPRDISKIFFYHPRDRRYYPIPYRDLSRPAISLYELNEAKRSLAERGKSDPDEALIFEAIERMRARVDEAVTKTKAARKSFERRPMAVTTKSRGSATPHVRVGANSTPPPPYHELAVEAGDDPFAEAITPFEEAALVR